MPGMPGGGPGGLLLPDNVPIIIPSGAPGGAPLLGGAASAAGGAPLAGGAFLLQGATADVSATSAAGPALETVAVVPGGALETRTSTKVAELFHGALFTLGGGPGAFSMGAPPPFEKPGTAPLDGGPALLLFPAFISLLASGPD